MTGAGSAVRALPGRPAGLTRGRRGTAAAIAVAGLPALTAVLVGSDAFSLASSLLLFLVAVVVVAVVGGTAVGVAAALASFLLANFLLIPPLHTFRVEDRDSLVALAVFLAVSLVVSLVVELAGRQRAAAARSRAEADVLARLATRPVATGVDAVLAEVADAFGMTSVALVGRPGAPPLASCGPPITGTPAVQVDAAPGLRLVADGPKPFAEDRRVLGELASAAARSLETRTLSEDAARGRELAEVDRLRSALLAAVGHDLRTPLAGIKAAVTALRQPDVALPPAARDELLATIESGADRLTDMVANLLDLSRLRAGALVVAPTEVALDEVVSRALVAAPGSPVDNRVADDLPPALADPVLLERVVANLVDNARRHEPAGGAVVVEAGEEDGRLLLRVVDHGPGVDPAVRERMFEPFQRLDDRGGSGVGLGLAIVDGFVAAMAGSVRASTTDGGGLTMTVDLPRSSS
jgi:two-component system sensor histidine kinase KdpD